MNARSGQKEFIRGVNEHRISGLLARRQYGKTTICAYIALLKMLRTPGHDVVFGSVKLDLGREMVRKEAAVMQRAINDLAKTAAEHKTKIDLVNGDSGKSLAKLSADDFAELYESSRLEFRLHHSNTVYSRTKIVALTPDAVGETGDLMLDEVGRIRKFREVWEAVKPIISSNPKFRCLLTTTPPPDDAHYSFELLAPPIGTELPVNPKGNWYKSELGVWVLRLDAYDAAADGVPLYDDDTGAPISPEESRRKESDKDAWDRNYGVKFLFGGSAAVGLMQLSSAQQRGIGCCTCVVVENDSDFTRALEFLKKHLGAGPVGVGVDWATTEKETSNPTAVTIMERKGIEVLAPLTLVWKTRDPDLAKERLRLILQAISARPEGGRARALSQDATSEKYFCADVVKELNRFCPINSVVASETIERAGQEPMTMKAFLGNQFIGEIDDNHVTLAPERYIKDDFRLVKRDRGSFTTDISAAGQHGDTFDSHKLALHALTGGTKEVFADVA